MKSFLFAIVACAAVLSGAARAESTDYDMSRMTPGERADYMQRLEQAAQYVRQQEEAQEWTRRNEAQRQAERAAAEGRRNTRDAYGRDFDSYGNALPYGLKDRCLAMQATRGFVASSCARYGVVFNESELRAYRRDTGAKFVPIKPGEYVQNF
ncbi:hypothetical protein [Burkholderia sp. Cy-637]|uniref:hypothetical protein n=1 Tax=Burkholderia sp. Cy-637 TaxID=2608327 RepID=UPI00141DADA1|nr:hypothetical protein [Burkholderia sp. Cy-637]NIF88862.1 hypothetical protein [Burkholderia sp. Cy-637]